MLAHPSAGVSKIADVNEFEESALVSPVAYVLVGLCYGSHSGVADLTVGEDADVVKFGVGRKCVCALKNLLHIGDYGVRLSRSFLL